VQEFMLVDDRDGRVLAVLEDVEQAFELLDEVACDDPELADALCIVRFDSHHGTFVGAESTTRVRLLT
jgi:hypothetical protein